jgi:hypothetical protein
MTLHAVADDVTLDDVEGGEQRCEPGILNATVMGVLGATAGDQHLKTHAQSPACFESR